MYKLEKIIRWQVAKKIFRALILTGSLASRGFVDNFSDYDIAVYGKNFDFIKTDKNEKLDRSISNFIQALKRA